jgi:hypothetical protein
MLSALFHEDAEPRVKRQIARQSQQRSRCRAWECTSPTPTGEVYRRQKQPLCPGAYRRHGRAKPMLPSTQHCSLRFPPNTQHLDVTHSPSTPQRRFFWSAALTSNDGRALRPKASSRPSDANFSQLKSTESGSGTAATLQRRGVASTGRQAQPVHAGVELVVRVIDGLRAWG